MSKILKSVISIVLALCIGAIASVTAFASTADYICDVVLATGKTVDEACASLKQKGYTPVKDNLNKDTNQQAVVLGYKTTTEKKDAITDLAVMDMKGGYSFAKYEDSVNQQKKNVETWLKKFYITIETFKENYEAEEQKAVSAYEIMNQFIEDDSGMAVGDFLIDDNTTEEQLKVFFLQANTNIVAIIKNSLFLACSTDWLTSVEDSDLTGTYNASVDDCAKNMYKNLETFQNGIKSYEQLKINDLSEDELVDKLETLSDTDRQTAEIYTGVYNIIKNLRYGESNLYDYLMQNYEDFDISTLYPIIDAMSEEERACLDSETILNVINYAAVDEDTDCEKIVDKIDTEKVSAYSGVDRTIFEPKGIALTDDALRRVNTSGESAFSSNGLSNSTRAVLMGVAGAAFLIGIVSAVTFIGKSTIATWYIDSVGVLRDLTVLANEGGDAFMASCQAVAGTIAKVSIAVLAICVAVFLIATAIILFNELRKSGKEPYSEIPRILVNQYFDDLGESHFTNYYCVRDLNDNLADLNADNGDQWNALYYTKDTNAGKPLTADALVQYKDNSVPDGYRAVHGFGTTAAFNLNKHTSNNATATYLFFKNATTSSNIATVFSNSGSIALAALAGLIVGAVGTFFVDKKRAKGKTKTA